MHTTVSYDERNRCFLFLSFVSDRLPGNLPTERGREKESTTGNRWTTVPVQRGFEFLSCRSRWVFCELRLQRIETVSWHVRKQLITRRKGLIISNWLMLDVKYGLLVKKFWQSYVKWWNAYREVWQILPGRHKLNAILYRTVPNIPLEFWELRDLRAKIW